MDLLVITCVTVLAVIHCSGGAKVMVKLPENLNTQNNDVSSQILSRHNDLRRSVTPKASDMLKLEWSQKAASNAAKWAEACVYGHSPEKERDIPQCSCGENILLSPGPMSWRQVIQIWYDEHRFFTYGKGGVNGKAVGHYTQIVEAKSYYLGCAVAPCNGSFYYVCQYCPPGNVVHRLTTPYTTGEPCSNCAGKCDDGLCVNQCFYYDKARNCDDMKPYCGYKHVEEWCEASCKCD